MVIKNYIEGDIAKVRIRLGDDLGGFSESAISNGPAYTFWKDEEPVAVMGVIPAYTGVGGVWCVISDSARGKGTELSRRARRLLTLTMERLNLHRVHAFVRRDNSEYIRWARFMGFNVEGVMFKGTPEKKDMVIMAKVN